MDVRERLVELLKEISYDKELNWYDLWDMREGAEIIADLLVAHGVTVQEWFSVEDKLPSDREWVLVWHTGYATPKKAKYKDDFAPYLPVFLIDGDNGNKGEVTHWQPLPQPPKGE